MVFKNPCNKPHSELSFSSLRLFTQIGWSEVERQTPQVVKFDVCIRFPAVPRACETDELSDTFCYDKLSQLLKEVCAREHRLIEKLGWDAYTALEASLSQPEVLLKIRITKESPPIPEVEGGASFTLGDWES